MLYFINLQVSLQPEPIFNKLCKTNYNFSNTSSSNTAIMVVVVAVGAVHLPLSLIILIIICPIARWAMRIPYVSTMNNSFSNNNSQNTFATTFTSNSKATLVTSCC